MKNRVVLILFFAGLYADDTRSQALRRPLAAPYSSLGAYSSQHVDAFSFTANQAALAQITKSAIGIYGERRFSLQELSYYNASFALPTSSGNFGFKTMYYGFRDYNETQLGLAYGRKLGNRMDFGAQFNYNGINIKGYGNASAVNFELGTIFHVTDQVHAGIHINNPVGGKFGKGTPGNTMGEKLPFVYTFGMGYEASDLLLISTELIKEEDQPVNINAGIHYRFLPQLHARAGIATAVSTAWFGIGLHLKSFRIDLSGSYHPQLGISPGMLLLFHLNKKEN